MATHGNIVLLKVRWHYTNTESTAEFIGIKAHEGKLSADMAFLFTFKKASAELKKFLTELIIAFNLVDDFNDADEDYEEGLMTFKPNIKFRLGLLLRAAKSIWKAFQLHPEKWDFIWKMRSRSNFMPQEK